jgi:diguanylate cyclase (GGDEF)-like protein
MGVRQMALDGISEIARLNALSQYAILDTPEEGAFDRLTALTAQLFEVPIAGISFVDSRRVWFKSVHGPAQFRSADRAAGLCGAAVAQDDVLVIGHASADPAARGHPFVVGAPGIEFYMGAPLKTPEGHVLGALCCMDTRPRRIVPEQRDRMRRLADVAMDQIELRRAAAQISRLSEALAEACSEMERKASYDSLTGVLAREALLERSAKLLARARTGLKGAAVLILDVDHFKSVNDSFGHQVGDKVLQVVARRMASACRVHDLLGRLGGEEFMAVFSDVSFEQARRISERLQAAVCRSPVHAGGALKVDVSVSGGLLVLPPSDEAVSLTEAISIADHALYAAKSSGRNRIVIANAME